MRKRIGTKIYDTTTAVCVIPELNLYKKLRSFDFFFFDGDTITPASYQEAEILLTQAQKTEFLKRKSAKDGFTCIGISASSADKLAAYCRKNGLTQKEVLEGFIDTLRV